MLSQHLHLPKKYKSHGGKKIFFLISILPKVKISLPIFMYENKLFMFYNVPLFWSNQRFALGLWPHKVHRHH